MLHTLITRLHGRARKATSSSCLVALLIGKRHFNDASLNLPLKLSLSLHHQQAQSYSGGGDSSKISNSIQAMSKYCSATINKQFDLSLRPRLALKLHYDMSMYIITGFARNLESTTSISRTYRPKASQLTVLQNCCLVRDTKIGYHFYISVLFLLHNELLQYKYSSWFLLHGFYRFNEAVHSTMLYTFKQGYRQTPYRTEANQISHAFEDAHQRGQPTPRRRTITHLALLQSSGYPPHSNKQLYLYRVGGGL